MAEAPLVGRVVPEFGRTELREAIERSYRIVYRIEAGNVRILTVFEGHRLLRPSDVEAE